MVTKAFYKISKLTKLVRLNKGDITGSLISKRRRGWEIIWMLYYQSLHRRERKKYNKNNLYRDFFRMMYIPKPIHQKRKSRFTKYFYHRMQFRLFYGCLKTKYIKNAISLSKKKKNKISYFIYLMELRLDVVLYRLNLTATIREARQLVLHGKVMVNNLIVKNPSYALRVNDLLSFKKSSIYTFKKKIFSNIKRGSFIISSIPNYVEYSYKNLKFKFTYFNVMDIPKVSKLNRNAYSHLIGLI